MLIGLDAPDDAAVMLPPPGMAVVQSVDHFRAFIDDPFVFGEIAAAHALSDLHAMGARPWTALAVAAVPYTSGDKMRTELADMLQGASARAGGGRLRAGRRPQRRGGRTGTGFRGHRPGRSGEAAAQVGAAAGRCAGADQAARHRHRAGRAHARSARAPWLQAAIASMRTSNATASRILREFGAVACTDVTGFGLAGHLLEMLRASGVGAVLWPDRVPALPGALELAAHGVESTLAPENRRLLPDAGTVAAHRVAARSADLGRAAGRDRVGPRGGVCRGFARRRRCGVDCRA